MVDVTRSNRIALVVLVALGSLSCELVPTTLRIEIAVPPTPAHWESAWGPARFSISWYSPVASRDRVAVADSGAHAVIEVPRVHPVAILATPEWPPGAGPALATGETLYPAGAVWPETGVRERRAAHGLWGSNVVAPAFERGPAAEVVRRVVAAGADLRTFSVARLQAEIHDRLPDDPWLLDVDRVAAAIARDEMRVSYVTEKERHPGVVDLPAGEWLRRSPFVGAIEGGTGRTPGPEEAEAAAAETEPVEREPIELPVGVTVFYSGDGRRLIVGVDAEGRVWQPGVP